MATNGTAFGSGYADVDGLRVYYELHGGAPDGETTPLVLLHGGLVTIETAFADDYIPTLAAIRPVIAIEQQGHGHTGDRDTLPEIGRMVEDTAGVLAHLGVRRAHILGHSLGGIVSIGLAIHRPSVVASATAVSMFFNLDGMVPELAKLQRDPTHQPSPELIALLPTEADFAAWRESFERHNPDPESWDRVVGKVNQVLTNWPGWTEAELRSIRAPVLVAIGDNDFTRVEHAAEMARLIPDAQLAVLPGTTHMSILTRGVWLEPMIEARIEERG